MPSPWLQVPLSDYEGHMSAPQVAQLRALADLFELAIQSTQPRSVAIVGIAGGNGLDRLPESVERVVGLDVCPEYLAAARERFPDAPLELHCIDLAAEHVAVEPVDLVHAALVFEHAGMERCLDNAVGCVARGGCLAVVLQRQSAEAVTVGKTGFDSLQQLAGNFQLIDSAQFTTEMHRRGFQIEFEGEHAVPSGKSLWLGLYRR